MWSKCSQGRDNFHPLEVNSDPDGLVVMVSGNKSDFFNSPEEVEDSDTDG
jgi:hypothetical protein